MTDYAVGTQLVAHGDVPQYESNVSTSPDSRMTLVFRRYPQSPATNRQSLKRDDLPAACKVKHGGIGSIAFLQ